MSEQPISSNDRLNILRKVEEGQINAEEAIRLLNGEVLPSPSPKMENPPPQSSNEPSTPKTPPAPQPQATPSPSPSFPGQPQLIKVVVSDTESGKRKVFVSMPLSLLNWGLHIGARFAPQISELDMGDLGEVFRSAGPGKILDVIDDEDGEHVEIFIE